MLDLLKCLKNHYRKGKNFYCLKALVNYKELFRAAMLLQRYSRSLNIYPYYSLNNASRLEIFMPNIAFLLGISYKVGHFSNTNTFYSTNTMSYECLPYYIFSKTPLAKLVEMLTNEKAIHFLDLKLVHVYGSSEDNWRFVNLLVHSLTSNKVKIELAERKQQPDFIYIRDVVDA